MIKNIAIIIFLIISICLSVRMEVYEPLLDFSIYHLLGTDEFGRDLLLVFIASAGLSLIKGICWAIIVSIISGILSYFLIVTKKYFVSNILRAIFNMIESCPVILWVFLIVASLYYLPLYFSVTIAFVLGASPFAINVISGEFERLWDADYVRAARLTGITEFLIVKRYILKNAIPILLPLTIHITGIALAIDGAMGVIGLGNRSRLDLGILLLRGKEQILVRPYILMITVAIFILIYLYLRQIIKTLKGPVTR